MSATPLESPKPLRADARRNRERILVAAREVFAGAGLDSQMDAVAERAGVGVGTVYRHFPTKEALLAELVAEQFRRFCEAAERALADEGADPFEAFAGVLRANAHSMAGDAGTRHAMTANRAAVWAAAEEPRARLLELSGRLIARAQAAGTMRADVSPGDLPQLMCGLSAVMGVDRPEFDWRRHLELLIDALRAR